MKIITSTADISIEELENTSGEVRIHDKDSYSKSIQKNYNASTLIKIKKAIKEFLTGVPTIDLSDPDREKKIFTYIYTKMAHTITYDNSALKAQAFSTENPSAERYADAASNLENAMLLKKCLCSGYSETLRNLLAECGIKSIVVSGGSLDGLGGHAWNQVYLDGEWYNCDITNDADNIKEGLVAPHFLKSNADCTRITKFPPRKPEIMKDCKTSISTERQFELIQEVQPQILEEIKSQEKPDSAPISKKPGFIQSVLQKLLLIKTKQPGGAQ